MATSEAALGIGPVHRLSTEEYHRLVESGGFDEHSRVELIDGLLADMSPKTPEHEKAIRWLIRRLTAAIDADRYELGVGSPLTLEGSEPEPDLAVIALDAPRPHHPATATLVIEVAMSSQQRDLVRKPLLYAAAGVEEYWVIDLDARRAVVHRQPRADGYAEVVELAGGALASQALAIPALSLDELLSAADA